MPPLFVNTSPLPLNSANAIAYNGLKCSFCRSGTDFVPESSDADFLVEFSPSAIGPTLKAFFELQADLSQILGYAVDLAETAAMRNALCPSQCQSKPRSRLCSVIRVPIYRMQEQIAGEYWMLELAPDLTGTGR
ncbi:MAG: hypothetical protein NTY50_05085 [Methylobacter sp.]|nr:hypothetical protein [Methylobacter sp.]